ncbi:unnamed protein product, partial [Prorocentrum cordatum]
ALKQRHPEAGAELQAFEAKAAPPVQQVDKPKLRPELQREHDLNQAGVQARKTAEALDRAIRYEAECECRPQGAAAYRPHQPVQAAQRHGGDRAPGDSQVRGRRQLRH